MMAIVNAGISTRWPSRGPSRSTARAWSGVHSGSGMRSTYARARRLGEVALHWTAVAAEWAAFLAWLTVETTRECWRDYCTR
jgi:hypothetical protein